MTLTDRIARECSSPTTCSARVFTQPGWFADLYCSTKTVGMRYDPNRLEACAAKLKADGRHRDAMAIYLHMADGDPSLDAGYLAMQIGVCCERLGDLHMAQWWYGRAVEENPSIGGYVEARQRMEYVGIAALVDEGASA